MKTKLPSKKSREDETMTLSIAAAPQPRSALQQLLEAYKSSSRRTAVKNQRASFNSTTDSFPWCHDPYTLACKARPSFDRCGTSLSVIVIVIVIVNARKFEAITGL